MTSNQLGGQHVHFNSFYGKQGLEVWWFTKPEPSHKACVVVRGGTTSGTMTWSAGRENINCQNFPEGVPPLIKHNWDQVVSEVEDRLTDIAWSKGTNMSIGMIIDKA